MDEAPHHPPFSTLATWPELVRLDLLGGITLRSTRCVRLRRPLM
jgi:hypothetical protein